MKILKPQKELVLTGILTIISAILLMVIYYNTGDYIIHPLLYPVILLGGIGWLATGITSIIEFNKKYK
ncbi:hypothetical protein ACFHWD_04390 [Clostridium sp. MT-14]|uniref:hypothetical protein n=1 Tax=Clostridium sp. MT-14 TaxID=3348360 RepID=UPI0035F25873